MDFDPNVPITRIEGGLVYGASKEMFPVIQDLHIVGHEIGVLEQTKSGPRLDASDLNVLPGFIDLHVHGGGGSDTMEADPASIRNMGSLHLQHGTTSLMPTTTTAALPRIEKAVQAVGTAIQEQLTVPRILGAHVEGPFISPKFPGAQNPKFICLPDLDFVARLADIGVMKLMTLAPEISGAQSLISSLQAARVVAVTGHTASTYAEAAEGAAWGIRQATHTYNAMLGLHHREPGAVGWILQDERIFAQLIADNIHVHPGAIRILALCKTMDRLLLVTDAISATGQPEGLYELGDLPVRVLDGACRLPDGTLAGSVLTMEKALANLIVATDTDLATCWPASSLTAAVSCGWGQRLGRLQPGYLADVVLLTNHFEVAAVLVDGCLRHLAPDYLDRLVT